LEFFERVRDRVILVLVPKVRDGSRLVSPLALKQIWFTSTLPRRCEDLAVENVVPKDERTEDFIASFESNADQSTLII
jgi:hypothetical protein